MSALFLAIPLTIFVLFVAPIWLWLHYSNRQNSGAELSQNEMQRLQQLTQDAKRMRERIQALEEILDAEHPHWRQP
ncbi:envelope stress response membrane protein PspB [Winslowiella iniecta]|uniref:Phage shock protein n=1 Tax=Winslowiella iniecta TaxID=1560201 RepID=A0A0L7T4I7_9GAMM|nr:envelope stress response membrane protein PspB [Winslowiella iniecta]KOC90265.1 phage shock protein [Winslowiella iniecta]KOC94773.1 phage shock protein [Winslowiella iniecta]